MMAIEFKLRHVLTELQSNNTHTRLVMGVYLRKLDPPPIIAKNDGTMTDLPTYYYFTIGPYVSSQTMLSVT